MTEEVRALTYLPFADRSPGAFSVDDFILHAVPSAPSNDSRTSGVSGPPRVLDSVRSRLTRRAEGACEEILNALAALLEVTELPVGQRQVLSTSGAALLKVIVAANTPRSFAELPDAVGRIFRATISEAAQQAAATPNPNIRTIADLHRACGSSAQSTLELMKAIRRARLSTELAADDDSTACPSVTPVATAGRMALAGVGATLVGGIGEIHAVASYCAAERPASAAEDALRILASSEPRDRLLSLRRWARPHLPAGDGAAATRIASQWVANSFCVGRPFGGERVQRDRVNTIVDFLRAA